MAIIFSYPLISSLANDDRLLISDMDAGNGNPTKSVTISQLATFLGVPAGGPFVPYVDGLSKRIARTEETNKNTSLGFEALASNLLIGTGNVAMGYNAGKVLEGGLYNVMIGYESGIANVSGVDNVLIGRDAGKAVTQGTSNVIIGPDAGEAITTEGYNVCIGRLAGNALTESSIVCIGSGAGRRFTTGSMNTFLGAGSGAWNVASTSNTLVGWDAGHFQTGSTNTFVGALAGYGATGASTGTRNVGVGQQSLSSVETASNNTAIGWNSGQTITTGGNNSCIGHNALPTVATVSNEFTLGDSSVAVLRCQQTTITAWSDQRDKTSIEELPYGLDFVDSLQPKKFIWDNRPETDADGEEYFSANKGKKDIGFIAQELQTVDDEWLNLVYDSNPDRLEASYGKLIPVLVKAIKELKARVEALEA
jgi:hypothetical protein